MNAEELLTKHGIKLPHTKPGRYYTTCPRRSTTRSTKEHRGATVLGVTIEGDGSVHWGCNHCDWTGPEKGAGKNGNGRSGEGFAATYDYVATDGGLLFQKVRNAPGQEPRFWLRRPDDKGGWINGTKGVNTAILYHAPDVARAITEGRIVAVVEGEKDANSVRALGIIATCNAHGASELGRRPKWTQAHSEQLRGADIVVLNDNDGAGYAHADATCSLGIAKRVRRLDLAKHWPDMPKGNDVSDWLALGHTREDLDALIAGAPDYQPQASEQGPQESGPVDDAVEIEKLARMPALDYERTRKAAAERLGIKRLSLLDGLVKAKRAELGLDGGDGLQGRAIEFPEPEPWPQPVDGGALLDGIAKAIRAHVVMSDTGRDACALWVVHSYLTEHFLVSPRLGVRSPTKGCGKTLLLDVLGCLVRRPLPTASVTPAAIFRVIESHDPTLLIDEADTFLRDNEELRGMLNSGHRRGAGVLRIVGEEHAPRAFATYGACAIALIGALPDTLHDRAITIDLKRRLASEKVEPFRPDRAENLEVLARQAARWTADNAERVAAIDPEMPANIINREGDNWRPLIAIADAAAGTWPQRARQAAQAAHNAGASDDALVELLLGDIRDIFGKGEDMVPEIASADLVKSLVDIEGHPWAEMGRSRKALTQHGLARLLKPLGIPTQKIGPADDRVSGYVRAHFEEAFRRYLGPDGVSDSDTRTECDEIRTSEIFDSDSPDPSCPSRKCEKSNNDGILSDCPSRKGGERPNAHDVRFRAMRRARLERRGAMRLLRTSRGQLGGVRRRRLHAPASRLRTAPGSRAAWPKKGYGVLERSPPKRKAALRRARQRQREPSRHALRNRAHRQRVKAGRIVVPVEIGLGELEWLVSVRWITPAEADAGDSTIGAAIAAGLAASVKGRIGALRRSPNTSVGKRITPLRKHHLFFFPTQPHKCTGL